MFFTHAIFHTFRPTKRPILVTFARNVCLLRLLQTFLPDISTPRKKKINLSKSPLEKWFTPTTLRNLSSFLHSHTWTQYYNPKTKAFWEKKVSKFSQLPQLAKPSPFLFRPLHHQRQLIHTSHTTFPAEISTLLIPPFRCPYHSFFFRRFFLPLLFSFVVFSFLLFFLNCFPYIFVFFVVIFSLSFFLFFLLSSRAAETFFPFSSRAAETFFYPPYFSRFPTKSSPLL